MEPAVVYLVTKLALVKGTILQRPSATHKDPVNPLTNELAHCGLHVRLRNCMQGICSGPHLSVLTQETC
jgi:hypothetical protein